MNTDLTIGERIRLHRTRQRMSQAELAEAVSVRGVRLNPTSLSRYELGERRPQLIHLLLIAIWLGLSLRDLGVSEETYPELRLLALPDVKRLIGVIG